MDHQPEALILVVDDDVRTARLLVRMLREDGFNVELACDGAAALERLGRLPMPDVLVTDIRILHADGMAVARYARSQRAALPVLVITSYPDLASRGDALEPAPLVLSKPLDYAHFSDELRRVTGA